MNPDDLDYSNEIGERVMHWAACTGGVDMMIWIVSEGKGGMIHSRDNDGWTILFRAIYESGHEAATTWLIEHGADRSGDERRLRHHLRPSAIPIVVIIAIPPVIFKHIKGALRVWALIICYILLGLVRLLRALFEHDIIVDITVIIANVVLIVIVKVVWCLFVIVNAVLIVTVQVVVLTPWPVVRHALRTWCWTQYNVRDYV